MKEEGMGGAKESEGECQAKCTVSREEGNVDLHKRIESYYSE